MSQTSYVSRSRVFLAQAIEELQRDDLCQASEKGWGAAAEVVKAVADARGWEHSGHRQLYSVVSRLVAETNNEELRSRFAAAGQLRTNFYEDWLDRVTIEAHLSQVTRFVDFVERMESLVGES